MLTLCSNHDIIININEMLKIYFDIKDMGLVRVILKNKIARILS